jgi:hypothetical protein
VVGLSALVLVVAGKRLSAIRGGVHMEEHIEPIDTTPVPAAVRQ